MDKKQLGAFYTTDTSIMDEFKKFVMDEDVIDLYAGDGDLLRWAQKNGAKTIVGFDINATTGYIVRDTLMHPPNVNGMVVINPPYLLRNKAEDKRPFEKYQTTDLYKCALLSLIDMPITKGIAIIPTNMFVDNDDKFRDRFYNNFEIKKVKSFDRQVFEDTNVRVSIIYFERGQTTELFGHTLVNTRIGEEYFKLIEGVIPEVKRLTIGMKPTLFISNITLFTTDTGGTSRIRLERSKPFYGKNTDRNKATLVFTEKLTEEQEQYIIDTFNIWLEQLREKYDSMFLTNFLAGRDGVMRKRIGFNEAFKLITVIKKELEHDKLKTTDTK